MAELTPENIQDLRRAFDLTQDSGMVDQYGAKKMLQIFNMNPTTEDVTKRFLDHNKDASCGLTFDEFQTLFHEYLLDHQKVPGALDQTLDDLFDGEISKPRSPLRKILTEMGSEPFEPEEADEVINEIAFDDHGMVPQDALKSFLLNRVKMAIPPLPPEVTDEPTSGPPSPEAVPSKDQRVGDPDN